MDNKFVWTPDQITITDEEQSLSQDIQDILDELDALDPMRTKTLVPWLGWHYHNFAKWPIEGPLKGGHPGDHIPDAGWAVDAAGQFVKQAADTSSALDFGAWTPNPSDPQDRGSANFKKLEEIYTRATKGLPSPEDRHGIDAWLTPALAKDMIAVTNGREPTTVSASQARAMVTDLDLSLAQVASWPEDTTVFKGTSLTMEQARAALPEGTEIAPRDFTSVSMFRRFAEGQTPPGKVMFRIHMPKGHKAIFANEFTGEVILPRGTHFTVTGYQELKAAEGTRYTVHVTGGGKKQKYIYIMDHKLNKKIRRDDLKEANAEAARLNEAEARDNTPNRAIVDLTISRDKQADVPHVIIHDTRDLTGLSAKDQWNVVRQEAGMQPVPATWANYNEYPLEFRSEAEHMAHNDYTGNNFGIMQLKGQAGAQDEESLALDRVTHYGTLSQDTTLYRGVVTKAWLDELGIGGEWSDSGWTSTTTSHKVGGFFASDAKSDSAIVIITAPKGTKYGPGNPKELEVLLPRGSAFRLNRVIRDVYDPFAQKHLDIWYAGIIEDLTKTLHDPGFDALNNQELQKILEGFDPFTDYSGYTRDEMIHIIERFEKRTTT